MAGPCSSAVRMRNSSVFVQLSVLRGGVDKIVSADSVQFSQANVKASVNKRAQRNLITVWGKIISPVT